MKTLEEVRRETTIVTSVPDCPSCDTHTVHTAETWQHHPQARYGCADGKWILPEGARKAAA